MAEEESYPTVDQLFYARQLLGVRDGDDCPVVDEAIRSEFELARLAQRRPTISDIKHRLGVVA